MTERLFCDLAAPLVFNKVVAAFFGTPSNPKAAEEAKALLVKALGILDNFWCKEGLFLCGAEEISIADLIISCELSQLKVIITLNFFSLQTLPRGELC